ncbi:MAG TPA: SDR family oxidoreductase [Tepidisphaeraceae bacterium]|jgi:NAD(P)-dependent dehydrogenase (short-subunit alcohol dehydrogenase family)|nr:SDR family oxidoreductase [Tepidisphaeraceae bacterium]
MNSPVAIIAGAGRGVGRETARLLASAGYRIAIVARTASDLTETARLAGGSNILSITADVSDPDAAAQAVAQAADHFGTLDALVNCAGIAPQLSIEQTSIKDWHDVLDTNLSSAFYLAKAAWPVFKKKQGGVIVNVSSEASRDPFPGFLAYASAKAGLNLLGKVLAKEGEPDGIRVHTVAPGAIETGMLRKLLSVDQYPADKTLAPEDVAKVIIDCIAGPLKYSSGEVIWLHKTF